VAAGLASSKNYVLARYFLSERLREGERERERERERDREGEGGREMGRGGERGRERERFCSQKMKVMVCDALSRSLSD
jgi:hypothetical protein